MDVIGTGDDWCEGSGIGVGVPYGYIVVKTMPGGGVTGTIGVDGGLLADECEEVTEGEWEVLKDMTMR